MGINFSIYDAEYEDLLKDKEDEIEILHRSEASWAYGGFTKVRTFLAGEIGVVLKRMYGYYQKEPSNSKYMEMFLLFGFQEGINETECGIEKKTRDFGHIN